MQLVLHHIPPRGRQNCLEVQGWCCGCGGRWSNSQLPVEHRGPADPSASALCGNSERTRVSLALRTPPRSRSHSLSTDRSSPLHRRSNKLKHVPKHVKSPSSSSINIPSASSSRFTADRWASTCSQNFSIRLKVSWQEPHSQSSLSVFFFTRLTSGIPAVCQKCTKYREACN